MRWGPSVVGALARPFAGRPTRGELLVDLDDLPVEASALWATSGIVARVPPHLDFFVLVVGVEEALEVGVVVGVHDLRADEPFGVGACLVEDAGNLRIHAVRHLRDGLLAQGADGEVPLDVLADGSGVACGARGVLSDEEVVARREGCRSSEVDGDHAALEHRVQARELPLHRGEACPCRLLSCRDEGALHGWAEALDLLHGRV